MKTLKFIIDLPFRFVFALLGCTFCGWIGWVGLILIALRFFHVISWPWWAAALPLEYGVLYCLYMTIDGALYRAGLKGVGGYASFTSFESREAEEAFRLSQTGPDAYTAEKEAELRPKIDAIITEAKAREKDKERQNE